MKRPRPTKPGPYRVTTMMLRFAARNAVTAATHSGSEELTQRVYARWQALENEYAAERGIPALTVS